MTIPDRDTAPRANEGARRNWFIAAAAVTAAGAAIHLFAGTTEVMLPLYASDVPPESAAVLDMLWQQMTVLLIGGAGVMAVAAVRPGWRQPVAWLVGGHFIVAGAIFAVWSFIWFGQPWTTPQWALFLPVGGMLLRGARR